ncbi:MAG: DNA gyrase subunit A [Thermotogae bacterium]|nr:DNA gyrase subunit A [Thermotogota bacterium]
MSETGEVIIERSFEDEISESYLTYSLSVIIGRAIPDVRDGLKPVQRRIIYAMHELGLTHKVGHKKSARIVGEVMGKYHPHGDAPIYDALVRMAQDFSMRYPLVDGQGNFGSIDRDPPAAMRYTEARLSKIAQELVKDIDKNTVRMIPNFDNSLEEPEVLPSAIPTLLMNGASGIAVGMATNIPPHNLRDLVDAIVAYIEDPEIDEEKLFKVLKGPDFPTGGIVQYSDQMKQLYLTGHGKFTVRAKVNIEESKSGPRIVITEIPYGVSKADIVTQIAKYAEDDDSIRNLRDESDRKGIRVVVELKKNAVPKLVLNRLFIRTNLQVTFGGHLLVVDEHKRPRLMNLKELIAAFVKHRFDVITKKTEYELEKATKRAHILEGLMAATRAISTVVDMIRNSRTVEEAKEALIEVLGVTETQATAILEMRLSRLTSLESDKLAAEYAQLNEDIRGYKELLESPNLVYKTIAEDLLRIKEEYGDDRRTQIVYDFEEISVEDLIEDEDIVVTLTRNGYIKATELKDYRRQSRGGKGLRGMKTSGNDYVKHVIVTSRLSKTLFITNEGRAYSVKNYELDVLSRDAKGKVIQNYLRIDSEERVKALIHFPREISSNAALAFFTKKGKAKRTALAEFANIRSSGVRAINLEEGDQVIETFIVEDESADATVLMATKRGRALRFPIEQVRIMGRAASGVIGMRLREGDEVVGAVLIKPGKPHILTITEKGFGKRTPVEEYTIHNRGGMGIRNLSNLDKAGSVVGVLNVDDSEEVLATTKSGKMIRFPVSQVRIVSRAAMGVKVMNLDEGDVITSIALAE